MLRLNFAAARKSRAASRDDSDELLQLVHRSIRLSVSSWKQFQYIRCFLNSSDSSVREDQFILFVRAEIFNNRVEQRLVDIQAKAM
jgi:hypothetical protein